MPLYNYKIPSATETVCITETELMALEHPATKPYRTINYTPIPGERMLHVKRLPDGYFITDHGRLIHRFQKKNGREVSNLIKGTLQGKYRRTMVTDTKGKKIIVRYARIMLEAFFPRRGTQYLQAVALDGDPTNLLLSNWTWMATMQANAYRRESGETKPPIKTRLVKGRYGQMKKRSAYSDNDIAEIERLMNANISINKIAEIFGCTVSYLSYMKKQLKIRLRNERSKKTG
jgi:hypothetical protein